MPSLSPLYSLAAVLISVIVYSPNFKTICYYFIFPKKARAYFIFLADLGLGGGGEGGEGW